MLRPRQPPQLQLHGCSSSSTAGRWAHVARYHNPLSVVLVRPSTSCDAGRRPGSASGGSPNMQGTPLDRMITSKVKVIDNNSPTGLQELQDIVNEWGPSFDFIHTSAAFDKAAHFQRLVQAAAQSMLDQLAGIWAAVLPGAGARGMANVLWACSKLNYKQPQLWSSTLDAYLQQVMQPGAAADQDLANVVYALTAVAGTNNGKVPGLASEEVVTALEQLCRQMHVLVTNPNIDVKPQHVSITLWGCAKLRIKPADTALDGMLQAFAGRRIREAAIPQHLANTLYAVSELQQRCGWQPQLREQVWQQLLSEEQLARIAERGTAQNAANVLLAVARLSTAAGAASPVISKELARRRAVQLLEGGRAQGVTLAHAQGVTNMWVRDATAAGIQQIALACAKLQLRDEQLLASLVQWCSQQLGEQQQGRGQRGWNRTALAAELAGTACVLGRAVTELNMRQLAGDVRALVGPVLQLSAGKLHPSDMGRLWDLHSWLLQHQLLDGQGLAGVLTQQQLAECKAERHAHVDVEL